MTINNTTVAQTQTAVSNSATREMNFQGGMDNIIAQVDRSVNRVNIEGSATGSATLADGTTDNALTVRVVPGTIGTAGFTGIPVESIDPNDLQVFNIFDVDGTTPLFRSRVFVRAGA